MQNSVACCSKIHTHKAILTAFFAFMQTTIYNMSDREIEASRCGESETKMRMRVRKWAKYREQNIYRQSIQGNGRNILSSVASIFSLFSIYIYSIFDLFRLVYIVEMCVCVCCMWAAVFGIVFDVSANKFYHISSSNWVWYGFEFRQFGNSARANPAHKYYTEHTIHTHWSRIELTHSHTCTPNHNIYATKLCS